MPTSAWIMFVLAAVALGEVLGLGMAYLILRNSMKQTDSLNASVSKLVTSVDVLLKKEDRADHWLRMVTITAPEPGEEIRRLAPKSPPPFPDRREADFPIVGPEQFQRSMRLLLGLLSYRAPTRYWELLHYLPQAVYTPELLDHIAAGNARGGFALDGSDPIELWKTVLHEVGHNVLSEWDELHQTRISAASEDLADLYRETVLTEMRLVQLWKATQAKYVPQEHDQSQYEGYKREEAAS